MNTCFQCGSTELRTFYEITSIPVHSCLLMQSSEEARSYPTGDLSLAFCRSCGFIQNTRFDPTVQEYSPSYEETQAFSPHFNAFATRLADELIRSYDLRGKEVLEIGCGKGDFLLLLAERGGCRGVGIDPAYREDRHQPPPGVRFIRDFYSEVYPELTGDLVSCRHTLEHIQPVRDFVNLCRRAVGPGSVVFFELPDAERVLEEGAFWDIYYEHCSYFTLGSLDRLFRSCALAPIARYKAFGDQYLCIEARLDQGNATVTIPEEDDLEATACLVDRFERDVTRVIAGWRAFIRGAAARGKRVALWGSGSKGVAFLTTLGLGEEVRCVVDVNPHRQGKFMPGSGHEIVSPSDLADERPDVVVVMNPVYVPEIERDLRSRGLAPAIHALGERPPEAVDAPAPAHLIEERPDRTLRQPAGQMARRRAS